MYNMINITNMLAVSYIWQLLRLHAKSSHHRKMFFFFSFNFICMRTWMCMKHTVIIIPCCILSQIIMFYTLHLYRAISQLCLNKTGRKNRHRVEKVSYDTGPFKCESNNKGAHIQATQACTCSVPSVVQTPGCGRDQGITGPTPKTSTYTASHQSCYAASQIVPHPPLLSSAPQALTGSLLGVMHPC